MVRRIMSKFEGIRAAEDLEQLIRAIYNSRTVNGRDEVVAFERAVQMLLARRPLLSHDQARTEVAAILAMELAPPA
jgi:hypothetical protein